MELTVLDFFLFPILEDYLIKTGSFHQQLALRPAITPLNDMVRTLCFDLWFLTWHVKKLTLTNEAIILSFFLG